MFETYIFGIVLMLIGGYFLKNKIFDDTNSKAAVYFFSGLILLLAFVVYSALWAGLSQYEVRSAVDRSECEWTQTSTTTYVECGGEKDRTDSHYVYENIEDSSAVEFQMITGKNVFGTTSKRLHITRK